MERELQEEIVIDLPELIALYLRKGFWIILISLLFAGAFVKLRAMPEQTSSTNGIKAQEADAQEKDLVKEKELEEKELEEKGRIAKKTTTISKSKQKKKDCSGNKKTGRILIFTLWIRLQFMKDK